jgi:hypothetical protein
MDVVAKKLSLAQLTALRDAGVDVEKVIPQEMRPGKKGRGGKDTNEYVAIFNKVVKGNKDQTINVAHLIDAGFPMMAASYTYWKGSNKSVGKKVLNNTGWLADFKITKEKDHFNISLHLSKIPDPS